jgi:hypothetical protein
MKLIRSKQSAAMLPALPWNTAVTFVADYKNPGDGSFAFGSPAVTAARQKLRFRQFILSQKKSPSFS